MRRALLVSGLALLHVACGEDRAAPAPLPGETLYAAAGSSSAPSGKGGFRFGAASAATQIEDQNPDVDWYLWTRPAPDGLGHGTFVGDAARGYTRALDDVDLVAATGLDSYRFSLEWARIEPRRGQIDEAALARYREILLRLKARGIRPMVTIHHFSNPVWVDDPRDPSCARGPGDANLCGLGHPTGGPLVIAAMAAHARLLGERFGDLVDDWGTLNEPLNYIFFAYGAASYPPGKFGLADPLHAIVPVARDYLAAHVAMYRALKQADTIDADGDGVAASVGLTKEANEWVAAGQGQPSTAPADVHALARMMWIYQYLVVDALVNGGFDSDLDGTLDEPHPDWKGTLDWLGVQYYFRAGVTAAGGAILGELTPCISILDAGACVPPLDPTYVVPAMSYEHDPEGLTAILTDFAKRWPGLPMLVTEAGIATRLGTRRAELIVRELEAIERARKAGADVRGYYHWSLTDNFEWELGFVPRFGLYTVDYSTYARTPTLGQEVLAAIARARKITVAQHEAYGNGPRPLTPEP